MLFLVFGNKKGLTFEKDTCILLAETNLNMRNEQQLSVYIKETQNK